MKKKTIHIHFIFIIYCFISSFTFTYSSNQGSEKSENEQYVKQIEDYFNNLTTLKSDFLQIDRNHKKSRGSLLIKRPNMVKMDYTDPATKTIIVKEKKLIQFDKELNEKTIVSIYSSPLSFFTKSKIKLNGDIKILSFSKTDENISVVFCKNKEEEDGAIKMIFQKSPFILIKWEIFNSKKHIETNESTQIVLFNQKSGDRISDFAFSDFD